jgi:hypothetical protein
MEGKMKFLNAKNLLRSSLFGVGVAMCLFLSVSAESAKKPQTDAILSKTSSKAPAPVYTTTLGMGDLLGTFAVSGSYVMVGLENDGTGNFLLTDIGFDYLYRITDDGTILQTIPLSNSGNPIGVTTDGSFIYVTDTSDWDVDTYMMDGTYVSSFPTSLTTFPEGLTYRPDTDTLFVVNGSGGDEVYEYSRTGTLLATYPLAAYSYSPDGIAWDAFRRCFWVYDSGSDSITQYDASFTWLDAFPGSQYNGYSAGEGLAVRGNRLYLVATSSGVILEFDITNAIAFPDFCIQDPRTGAYFQFNTETATYVYSDGNMSLTGTGKVTMSDCFVVFRSRENGLVVIASIDLCGEFKGNVVINSFLSLTNRTFIYIRRGIVNGTGCGGTGSGGGWPPIGNPD